MKVFQILNGFVHWDASALYTSAEEASRYYAPDVEFVEAPDYVFESWGYDAAAEGDARFIQPTPPEGWLYDAGTGTFYPEGETAPSEQPTELERLRADVDFIMAMEELL